MMIFGRSHEGSYVGSATPADQKLRLAHCTCLLLVLLLGTVTQAFGSSSCGMPCCQTPPEHQQHCHEMDMAVGHGAEPCASMPSRSAASPERCCSLSSEERPVIDQDRGSSQLPSLQPSAATVVVMAQPPSQCEDGAPPWRLSSSGKSRAAFLCTYLL